METVSNQFLMNRISLYKEIFRYLLKNMDDMGIGNEAQGPLAMTLRDFLLCSSHRSGIITFQSRF